AANQIVALRLLAGAFTVRLALFPFHLWAAPLPGLAARGVVLVPLATLLAGGVWLCRGALLWGSEIAPPGLALPAAFALALLGFLAWRHKDSATKVATLAAWHGGWVVWAVAYGRPDLGLLLIACGILGLAALALHGGTVAPGESGWLPALLSAAAVVGLPGSALFTAGSWLFGQALYRRAPIVALLAALGVSAVSVALVELLSRSESRDRQPSRTIGLMLLGLAAWPLVAGRLGLVPELPPASAGRFDADLPLAVRVGPLLLGWAAAILLWQVRAGLRPAQAALDAAAALFSLTWLGQLGGRLLEVAASGLRGAMRVVEGENYGWLVFFLVLTLFFLTRG
ncbi:MAG TPA: hypothetical protein VER55_04760, partial [Ardenticatenaceae bacterium]|nr:hypothetical protein [Ardenticatenaceae bacterium]